MLKQWLNSETVHICSYIDDWRAAIQLSAAPLIKNQTITSDYVEAIFCQHDKLGPYYVLAPGIAMPHARPEEGAKDIGLSLLVVKQGVQFNSKDNDPVYLVVMLAARDSDSHIEIITQLVELFSNQQDVDAIVAAPDIEAILEIIGRY